MSDRKSIFHDDLKPAERHPAPASSGGSGKGKADSLDDILGGKPADPDVKQKKGPGRLSVKTW
jgi:hypothetical protein